MDIKVTCKGADVLPIDKLVNFQGDLKKITEANLEKLKRRIVKHGINAPVFIWDNGEKFILDGHQRIKALHALIQEGFAVPLIPVVYIEAENEADAKDKLLGITSQYGEFDTEGFFEFTSDIEFEDIRFTNDEFIFDTGGGSEETTGDDDAPEVGDGEPESKEGEIYHLGVHRLMCGDSTDAEQVAKLMGGEKADVWITDPPYNVEYVGKTSDALTIQNDKMDNNAFREFLTEAFTSAVSVMKSGACYYIWHADSEGYNFRGACIDSGLKVRQCLVWNKNSLVMGRQDYHWKHEPCLYGWKDGAAHLWAADRKQTTVLTFDRPSRSTEHPTMKPVELIAYQVLNNTKGQDIVLDTFGGSGSTLIASAKTGRKCYMMELDPKYCDVIRRRWTKWARENGQEVGPDGLEPAKNANE